MARAGALPAGRTIPSLPPPPCAFAAGGPCTPAACNYRAADVVRDLRGIIPGHLRKRVDTSRMLDGMLADCIPADCARHAAIAGIEAGTLVLISDSPAWRTRLHFYSDRIIAHFNRVDGIALTRVKVRVGHTAPPGPPRRRRGGPAGPPAETARALGQLAASIDDEDLAAALRRLAQRTPGGTGGR